MRKLSSDESRRASDESALHFASFRDVNAELYPPEGAKGRRGERETRGELGFTRSHLHNSLKCVRCVSRFSTYFQIRPLTSNNISLSDTMSSPRLPLPMGIFIVPS